MKSHSQYTLWVRGFAAVAHALCAAAPAETQVHSHFAPRVALAPTYKSIWAKLILLRRARFRSRLAANPWWIPRVKAPVANISKKIPAHFSSQQFPEFEWVTLCFLRYLLNRVMYYAWRAALCLSDVAAARVHPPAGWIGTQINRARRRRLFSFSLTRAR